MKFKFNSPSVIPVNDRQLKGFNTPAEIEGAIKLVKRFQEQYPFTKIFLGQREHRQVLVGEAIIPKYIATIFIRFSYLNDEGARITKEDYSTQEFDGDVKNNQQVINSFEDILTEGKEALVAVIKKRFKGKNVIFEPYHYERETN